MGYSIYIGERTYSAEIEDFIVEKVCDDSAPEFSGDFMSAKNNSRHPSYGGWAAFCKETDLYDLFFNSENGLMHEHPGCVIIQKQHEIIIKKALLKRQQESNLPPGFNYNQDLILARLIWLDYWVSWALENCKKPAIYNN